MCMRHHGCLRSKGAVSGGLTSRAVPSPHTGESPVYIGLPVYHGVSSWGSNTACLIKEGGVIRDSASLVQSLGKRMKSSRTQGL